MRNLGLTHINIKTSNRVVDGGDQRPGSHSAHDTQRANVTSFPRLVSSQEPADDCDPSSDRSFILEDDTCAICALGIVVGSFVIALSAALYAGYKLFFLFDLG